MSEGRWATLPWLLAGVVVGAALTGGLVMLGLDVLRGDAPTAAGGPPRFVAATASGIDHVYDGEFGFFVGGGVATFDCDADRRPDLYIAGGANPARLYRNESSEGGLRFTPVSDPTLEMTGVTGAYPLDVDSDGVVDLAVLRVGENLMLRGLGECRFEVANDRWGVDGGDDWTVAFSATWEDGYTLPTLVFGNYLEPLASPDDERTCSDHFLFRPDGERYADPITLAPGYCTLSALFSDWGRSGQRDLRLTNDRHYYRHGQEQLWRIEPGESPRLYTAEDSWREMQIWGMGIASHDVTGDGFPEVYLTSQGDNKLQILAGGDGRRPSYEDMALPAGANAHRPFVGDTSLPSTGWHPEFDDVNNDGFIDLFVTKGNVEAQPGFAADDPNNLLLGRPDGTFVEAADAAGLIDLARSRGAVLADFDLDGALDVVVVERRQPVKVWRQEGAGGNWLSVSLEQGGSNRFAVGSWIQVRLGNVTLEREVTVGGGHASGELGPVHFGLGVAATADFRVQWPDGATGAWQTVDANQHVTLRHD